MTECSKAPAADSPARNKPVASASDVEARIIQAFCELLDIPEDFNRTLSFIQLGGQSIAALKLQIELMRSFSVRVPYSSMFEDGTVSGLTNTVLSLQEQETQR